MENKFSTKAIDLKKESTGIVSYSNLLSLIKDDEQQQFFNSRFNEHGEEFYIQLGKVDIAFRAVEEAVEQKRT